MNVEKTSINDISFTSSGENMCVSTTNGFIVFETSPFRYKFKRAIKGQQISKVYTLPNSYIVVYTGYNLQSQDIERNLTIFDINLGRSVLEITFTHKIINVILNQKMFAVSTTDDVRIYNINPPVLEMQLVNLHNECGPCDFMVKRTGYIVVFSAFEVGYIRIINTEKEQPDYNIKAHNHEVSYIKLNHDGSFVATASNIGTCIRLFNANTGDKIIEYRRGSFSAAITSIVFNPASTYLAVSSVNNTIHVFPVEGFDETKEIRSLYSFKVNESGNTVLSFNDRNDILVGNLSGQFILLTIDHQNKTLVAEFTQLFMTKIQENLSASQSLSQN